MNAESAPPLPPGTVLNGRYQLGRVLGQGGFGITYEAEDSVGGRQVVIKELAPPGSIRGPEGMILFESLGPTALHRLRSQFEEEGRVLQRLRVPGIVAGLDQFQANGTGYLVMERIQGAVSLQSLAQSEGRMATDAVLEIMDQVLDALEVLHSKGLIHRDLKPSNILIDPNGKTYLIDFGSVRQWTADLTVRHTVLFTPGFAPLEQLTENARRGPGTDLYGLAATAYYLLTGEAPASPGEGLVPVTSLRPDVPANLSHAIEEGLALRLEDRPSSVGQFRALLNPDFSSQETTTWEVKDRKLAEIRKLHVGKFECPACGDVLMEPKPAKLGTCIVCREGRLAARSYDETQCPCCRAGILRRHLNQNPLVFSPSAPRARLVRTGERWPWSPKQWTCSETGEIYQAEKDGLVRLSDQKLASLDEWRESSGRSEAFYECEACHAEFDELRDGRRLQIQPAPRPGEYAALYPEEWARVAKGHDPGSGNAHCERCHAEYFWEDSSLTLLSAENDPFDVLDLYQGNLITLEEARWIAAGKSSGFPGLTCVKCPTEFDQQVDGLHLVLTSNARMRAEIGRTRSIEDWHRISRALPCVADQPTFEDDFERSLRQAYWDGEFDPNPIWKSKALRDGKSGSLVLHERELEFGGLLSKVRIPLGAVLSIAADGPESILIETQDDRFEFEVSPMSLRLTLESGDRTMDLHSEDLARRIQAIQRNWVPRETSRNPETIA